MFSGQCGQLWVTITGVMQLQQKVYFNSVFDIENLFSFSAESSFTHAQLTNKI